MFKIKTNNPEQFVKRMFYLLWQASSVFGMGALQDNPNATEQDVLDNILTRGDDPGNLSFSGNVYGDYVFGRMMKFGCSVKDGIIDIPKRDFQPDYQSFSGTYSNNMAIVEATAKDLDVEFEILDA